MRFFFAFGALYYILSVPAKNTFGGEKKAFQERAKKWVLIYGEEAVNNIDIYGEMIHGDIKSDITTCTSKVKPILK